MSETENSEVTVEFCYRYCLQVNGNYVCSVTQEQVQNIADRETPEDVAEFIRINNIIDVERQNLLQIPNWTTVWTTIRSAAQQALISHPTTTGATDPTDSTTTDGASDQAP